MLRFFQNHSLHIRGRKYSVRRQSTPKREYPKKGYTSPEHTSVPITRNTQSKRAEKEFPSRRAHFPVKKNTPVAQSIQFVWQYQSTISERVCQALFRKKQEKSPLETKKGGKKEPHKTKWPQRRSRTLGRMRSRTLCQRRPRDLRFRPEKCRFSLTIARANDIIGTSITKYRNGERYGNLYQ